MGPNDGPDYLLAATDVVPLLAVVWTISSAVEYLRGARGVLTDPTLG